MTEAELRRAICEWGKSLFDRGLTSGSSGNLSVRWESGFIVTPTNSCLGRLDPDSLSRLTETGAHLDGAPPTKEIPLHLGMYEARPEAQAVVHLHSTYATALSCCRDIDPADVLRPLTPYVLMRAGRIPLIPYTDPGSADVRPLVAKACQNSRAVLLANHGPVASGASLEAAVFAAEEIEEAAKIQILLRGLAVRELDTDSVARLLSRKT